VYRQEIGPYRWARIQNSFSVRLPSVANPRRVTAEDER
jgi:hypothetical protein